MQTVTRTRSGNYPDAPGVVLIINNMDFRKKDHRLGSDVDEHRLVQLFGIMGFKVIQERNCPGRREFQGYLHASMGHFVEEKYSSGPFFLCILSHGNEKGVMLCDEDFISVDEILSLFMEDHCKNVENRAKVVLIQACRGNEILTVQSDGTTRVRNWQPDYATAHDRRADVLVFHSCVENRLSFRSSHGSRFIRCFCSVVGGHLASERQKCEILEAAREVISKMKDNLVEFDSEMVFATPEVASVTLAKNLYLSMPDRNRGALKAFRDQVSKVVLTSPEHEELADDASNRGCTCRKGCAASSKCRCRRAGRPCEPGCHQAANAPCSNTSWRCRCTSTCQTETCACYKAGRSCDRGCHPHSAVCQNGEAGPSTRGTSAPPAPPLPSAPGRSAKPGIADAASATAPAERRHACGCKTGCVTRRCGCVKADAPCNAECHPNQSDCQNRREGSTAPDKRPSSVKAEPSTRGSSKESRFAEDDTESESDPTTSCGCKTGCGTRRCGCMKAGARCNAECHPNQSDCQNKSEGGAAPDKRPSSVKAVPSSRGSSKESRFAEDDTESESDPTTSCGCKTGCGTRRCGCVKAGARCNAKCHPNQSDCQNKREGSTAPDERPSSVKAVSSSRGSFKESRFAADDAESQSDLTTSCCCKTGCGTRRCGCMKAGVRCNAKCHPTQSDCQNKGSTAPDERPSSAKAVPSSRGSFKESRFAEGDTESAESESDLTTESESDITTSCSCKTGCGTRRCGCQKAGVRCNAKCHPNQSDCKNK